MNEYLLTVLLVENADRLMCELVRKLVAHGYAFRFSQTSAQNTVPVFVRCDTDEIFAGLKQHLNNELGVKL